MSPKAARKVLEILDEFYSSPTPMWIFDQRSLAFLEVNEAAVRQYGYSREQFLKMTILDIRPFEDVSKVLKTALREHATFGEVWSHRRKDRSVFPVRIISHLVIFRGHEAELVSAQEVTAPSRDRETSAQTD